MVSNRFEARIDHNLEKTKIIHQDVIEDYFTVALQFFSKVNP